MRNVSYPTYRYTGRAWFRRRSWQRFGRREKWYYVERGRHTLLLHWRPYHGIRIVAERLTSTWEDCRVCMSKEEYRMAIKRRNVNEGHPLQMPGPVAASTILAKLPLLREFLSCTVYEDGSRRQTGRVSISAQGRLWEITVNDPDALAKLTVRDDSLDRCLLALETILGTEDAPWETDKWAAERAAKKGKK